MHTERKIKALIAVAALVMIVTTIVPFKTAAKASSLQKALLESEARIAVVAETLSMVTDAETGQRGFVITGQEAFLAPYNDALVRLRGERQRLRASLPAYSDQDFIRFEQLVNRKLAHLAGTIDIRRQSGAAAAGARISTGQGKQYMDELRLEVKTIIDAEHAHRERLRQEAARFGSIAALATLIATAVNGLLVAAALHFLFRLLKRHRTTASELTKLSGELSAGMAELERRNGDISLLARMARVLDSSMSLDETRDSISVFATKLLPHTSGQLFLYRNSRNLLEKSLQWGLPQHAIDAVEPQDCWGLRLGHVHRVDDQSDLCCPHHDKHAAPFRQQLCLPLSAHGEIVGLMTLEADSCNSEGKGMFRSGEVELSITLAEQLALALSNAKLKEMLKQQSIVDPLTGLFNRRYLDETLARELSRAKRKGCSLSLVMIDVDHFKSINDNFGHEAGDAVLRAIAERLKANVREGDLVCRFGGEEIVILMPECDPQNAHARTEKLRKAVRAIDISYGGRAIGRVTASFGVASYPHNAAESNVLIECADRAMYQAKLAGRDRVVPAGSAEPESLPDLRVQA